MSDIIVIFKNQPELHIQLFDTTAANLWKQLFTKNYQQQFPLFRDMMKYTWEYLEQLIEQANQTCGWNFPSNVETLDDTLDLHKHIEVTLANGYEPVPVAWHHILDELHFALHKIQQGNMEYKPHRGYFLQLEWFNGDTLPLPEDFVFTHSPKFGSLRLQNAYVGHTPLMIYEQNDFSKVFQTCRFHDLIRPGLHIMCGQSNAAWFASRLNDYQTQWRTMAPEFVEQHGWERIMYYTGHPIIGQVENLQALEQVYGFPGVLELQEVVIN